MKRIQRLTKILSLAILSVIFIQCKDEAIETAPVSAPLDLVQKSGKVSSVEVLSKLKFSVINAEGSELDAATGYLDKIYLQRIDGAIIQIWDSLEWFDFLDLEAGIGRDIAIVPIPPGIYTHAICDIVSADVNYEGKDYTCKVPGSQMIIEFIEPAEVTLQLSPDFIIEIDASKSFFPIYPRSLYKKYIMYLLKNRGKKNKEFVSFDDYKKNKKPSYFVMNPYLIADNKTMAGSVAGFLGFNGEVEGNKTILPFIPPFTPLEDVTLSLWDGDQIVLDYYYGLPAETMPFRDYQIDPETGEAVFGPGEFWIPGILPGNYQLKVISKTIVSPLYVINPEYLLGLSGLPVVEYLDIEVQKGNFNVATPNIPLYDPVTGEPIIDPETEEQAILPAGSILVATE